jgi:hypothetical protein
VEALVSIVFMAIVIPVALGAMRVASMAGEASQRKLVAARIANKVMNELRVEHMLQGGGQRGLVQENGVSYTWFASSTFWTGDTVSRMSVATVAVDYLVGAGGKERHCTVLLSTLVPPQS